MMKWFEGPIPLAIQSSKQNGVIFMVYIYGNDEMSDQMNQLWESEEIAKAIEESGAVAVRILNTSEECKFFSQIYPVICVPATYFIGEAGVPLEVTGGPIDSDQLKHKLELVLKAHESQKQAQAASAGSLAASSAPSSQESSSEAEKKPLQERVERAKGLIEQKREERAQKEKEKAHNAEIERRQLGHNLQKLKERQSELEMKELKDQMRKDKEEQRKAKEKIRKQIERDREERKARFDKEKQEREKAQEEAKRARLQEQQAQQAKEDAARSETARILVRLPDGSSMSTTFSSSETLQILYNAVSQRLGGTVCLSTTFPKRQFTQEDMTRSFRELQLAPTASVIALPASRAARSVVQSSSAGLLQMLLYPFFLIWNFLYSLFFGAGVSSSNTSSQQSREPVQPTQTYRPTTAYQRRRPNTTKQEGNIRRLTDVRGDDDDDMTTYNGNSTQQM